MKDKKKSKKKITALVIILFLIAGLILGSYLYVKSMLGNAERVELDEENLGIETEEVTTVGDSEEELPKTEKLPDGIINIALFGLDTRDMESSSGRSDAILVVTADTVHNKIKVTSFARDSYVSVDGHGKTKLTHAYIYGGPQLAVKTLNQNFGLNIKDFASVNFSQLASIIDFLGGVRINVTEAEKKVMEDYFEELNRIGVKTEPLEETGDVMLTGGQAVAYARNRYTGSDVDRMNRQYEVLLAMAESAKNLNVTQYDDLVKMILSECTTSFTDKEIFSLGMWALSNSPEICRYVLPNNECRASGRMIGGMWYFVFENMETVRKNLRSFIFES